MTNKHFHNTLTSDFSDQIFVICPICSGNGQVWLQEDPLKTIPNGISYYAVFQCSDCLKRIRNENFEWFGPICGTSTTSCKKCGFLLEKIFLTKYDQNRYVLSPNSSDTRGNAWYRYLHHTPQNMTEEIIVCKQCNYETSYNFTWMRLHDSSPVDPHLGLELLLKKGIKGNTLWAYNKAHIEFLRKYVNAKIRSRGIGGKYSLIVKLPKFVKDKKNKELIIKVLEKFENTIQNVQGISNSKK